MAADRRDVEAERQARWSTRLALLSLALWPLSYAWLPLGDRSPAVILALVPIAEIGSLLLAGAAIGLGVKARRGGARGTLAALGSWLGVVVIVLIVGGNLAGILIAR